jgi:hypothetical protein
VQIFSAIGEIADTGSIERGLCEMVGGISTKSEDKRMRTSIYLNPVS